MRSTKTWINFQELVNLLNHTSFLNYDSFGYYGNQLTKNFIYSKNFHYFCLEILNLEKLDSFNRRMNLKLSSRIL